MLERGGFRHRAGAQAEADWATLHTDDRVVSVFSRWRGRQSHNIPSFYLLHHLLKRERGDVMTFINNDLTILGDEVLNLLLAMKALHNGNVHNAGSLRFSASDLANSIRR